MLLDGSADASRKLKNMLFFDVNNGIARRAWARNEGAVSAISRAHESNKELTVTMPYLADQKLIVDLI